MTTHTRCSSRRKSPCLRSSTGSSSPGSTSTFLMSHLLFSSLWPYVVIWNHKIHFISWSKLFPFFNSFYLYLSNISANARECVQHFSKGWVSEWVIKFNTLAPGKFEWNSRYVIFKWILVIDGWGISCEIALIWMSLDLTDDQSTLVQVMAWYRQATSHYLGQCWPRSLSTYGVTRPEWVNSLFGTTDTGVHVVHTSHLIITYTLESLSSLV